MKQKTIIYLTFSLLILSCHITHKSNSSSVSSSFKSTPKSVENQFKVSEIDSLIKGLVLNNKTAGIAFGIQLENSDAYIRAYGLADVENKINVNASTQFRIASITKPITATAIMLLIQQGWLSLGDTVGKFFPDYPNGTKITIYQLLSHTSGIPNWWDGVLPENTLKSFPMCATPHKYLQGMKKPSLFEPGTLYAYSNSEYVLLGEIIEQVSGKSYQNFLNTSIFIPSNMKSTKVEEAFTTSGNWAKGYAFNAKKKRPFVQPDPIYPYMPFAAGALRSNVADMLNFTKSLFEKNLIKKELLEKMVSYATVLSGKPVYEANYFPLGFTPPPPPNHVKKNGYGLGLSLMETYGEPVIWHSGGIQGFNSIWVYIPKSRTSLTILSNTENGIVSAFEDIMKIATSIE